MELILFALLLVWLVYVIFSAGRRGQQQKVSWSGAAVRLGLVEGSTKRADELPVLQGTVDGHEVEIMLIWRGTGETRTPYTVVQSRLPGPLPAGLSVDAGHLRQQPAHRPGKAGHSAGGCIPG